MNASSFFENRVHVRRGFVFGAIIVTALLAFEMFNYSTTDYALSDLLGELDFIGIRWATILAIAFCGIDFAGIARLFTPGDNEPGAANRLNENWFLFGAWLLAATMNAMLTWWGVSLAVMSHNNLGNEVVSREVLLRVVPIFVAVLVWLIRVLIIGTFSVAGDRLFDQEASRVAPAPRVAVTQPRSITTLSARPVQTMPRGAAAPRAVSASSSSGMNYRSPRTTATKSLAPAQTEVVERTEPTYHPISSSVQAASGLNRTAPTPTRPVFNRPGPPNRR